MLANKKGFTLIEVIITAVIATIVLLGLGYIVLTTQRHWVRGGRETELQRDLSLSMDWIKRVLRDGERAKVLPGGESITVESLREGWRKRFYREGNNLRVETAGSSQIIVDNLTALSFSWGIRDIGVSISLSEYGMEVSAQSAATLRNRPLAAEWLFDENSGTTTRDTSPNRNSGTISGATWGSGKHGSALSFNGTNSLVRVSSDYTLSPNRGINIEARVNLQSTGRGHPIVEKMVPGASGYRLAVLADGRLQVGLATTSAFYQENSTGRINFGRWQTVGFTYDGTALRLYINGSPDRVIPATGRIIPNHRDLSIGANPGTGDWARGNIDEVRIAH